MDTSICNSEDNNVFCFLTSIAQSKHFNENSTQRNSSTLIAITHKCLLISL